MDEITIQDNGESEVQITTIGEVIGSDSDGNPITQNFSEEALQKVAETQKNEILVDSDHSSEKGGSTEAKGWLSKLTFKKGIGLIGTIKWTNIGRSLIENRVFRWLSPSWILNDKKEPVLMTSCALTNKPSQYGRIDPIINSKSDKEEEIIMTKEEVMKLISQALADNGIIKNEMPIATKEETKEETEEVTKDEVKNEGCQTEEETKEEVKNEEVPEVKEETKEEVKEEVKEEEKEVIKAESLNSAPVTVGTSINSSEPWRNLHGKEFFDWIAKNK